ncbi:MAG: helix-turn-helix domain-containing protein [Nitrososphaerales archaeon]
MLIKDERLRMALMRAIADEQALKILSRTIWKARSVMDLIKECNIPHTSAYRLVNELKDKGLLTVERIMFSKDGKKYTLYKSAFRNITIKFEGGSIKVYAEVNRNLIDKAFRIFSSLKEEVKAWFLKKPLKF